MFFEMDPKMDLYPGLDLGLKTLGAHLGLDISFQMVLDYLQRLECL
jgi:hypothetical protein